MSDPEIDELAESARNRGLKLVRSRVRTPGKRRFGRVGLTDARGQPVFGMDEKGPIGKPEDVEDYLRNLGAKDWGASLDVAVLPRKNKPRRVAADLPGQPMSAGRSGYGRTGGDDREFGAGEPELQRQRDPDDGHQHQLQ